MTRFGLNDSLTNHQLHPWQPARCAPDVFRCVCWWGDYTTPYDAVSSMGLSDYPERLGIVCLFGPSNQQGPTSAQYGTYVWNILESTPSNLLIEVWNEPNDSRFGVLTEDHCRELIATAVYADNGRGRVIGPGMNPGIPGWSTYMINAYSNHHIPASVHIYPESQPWTSDFDTAIKFADQANGTPVDPNKGIYITEMGLRHNIYGSACWGYAQDAFTRAAGLPNVRTAIYHRLRIGDAFDLNGSLYFYYGNGAENTPLVDAIDQVH